MIRTLRKCNINIAPDHYYLHGYSLPYHANYDVLLQNGYNVVILSYNSDDLLCKFLYLLSKKTPILYLVRDPIEILRSASDFPVSWQYWAIDLQDYDRSLLCNRVSYGVNGMLSINQRVRRGFDYNLYNCHKIIGGLQQRGFQDIVCIDMKEILPHFIFSTLQNLSQRFRFSIPHTKEDYEKTYYIRYANYMFPMMCQYVLHSEKIQIYVVLEEYLSNTENSMFSRFVEYHNITDFFNLTMPPFRYPIAIVTHMQYIKILQNNRESLQSFNSALQQLLDDIYQQIQIEESKRINETEILRLLENDIFSQEILKKAIDREIAYIKNVRPDIVQSWRYYQEFERICERRI